MDGRLRHDTGASLIELVVVIAILAVLAIGVSLVTVRGGSSSARFDKAQFQNTFTRHQDLAIQGHVVHGLRVSSRGLQAMQMAMDGWREVGQEQRWQGRVTLSGGSAAYLSNDGPQVLLLPTGQSNAFRIQFASSDTCEGHEWTGLTCVD